MPLCVYPNEISNTSTYFLKLLHKERICCSTSSIFLFSTPVKFYINQLMMLTEDDNNKDYGNYTWIYSMLVLASDNIELSS